MQLKTFITSFCFLVLTFQLLPVRQLGGLLFSNGITEELPHDDDSDGALKDYKDKLSFKKDFLFTYSDGNFSLAESAIAQYIHFSIVLPSPLAGDVQTPPPNIA